MAKLNAKNPHCSPNTLAFCRSLQNIITESYLVLTFIIPLQNGSCALEDYNCGEFGLLGNFLVNDGNPGKV